MHDLEYLKNNHPRNISIAIIIIIILIETVRFLWNLVPGIHPAQFFLILLIDSLIILAGTYAVWAAIFKIKNTPIKLILFYTYVALAFTLLMSSQQFLRKTGALIDLNLVGYFLTHAAELFPVLHSGTDSSFWGDTSILIGMLLLFIYFSLKGKAIMPKFFRYYFAMIFICMAASFLNQTTKEKTPDTVAANTYMGAAVSFFSGQNPVNLTSAAAQNELLEIHHDVSVISKKKNPPNFIFIILESMRYDSFNLIKEEFLQSTEQSIVSNIFQRGHYFNNLYTTVSHTSKALTGIFCGIFPHPDMEIIEATHDGLKFDCLPQHLNQMGYEVAFFQSADGSFENRAELTKNLGFNQTTVGEDLWDNGFQKLGYFGLDDKALIKPSIQWAKKQTTPYFMTLLTVGTHHPYEVPNNPLPEEDKAAYDIAAKYSEEFLLDFFTEIENEMDLDNTIVIVTSDHGEAFGEHGIHQHDMVPYEEVVHVPTLIWWKERESLHNDSTLRTQLDIFPTIMDFASDEWEGSLYGKSLFDKAGHTQVYSQCWYTSTCISMRQSNGIKAIYNYKNGSFKLFDLNKDPSEKNNLRKNYTNRQITDKFKDSIILKLSMDAFYSQFEELDK